MEKYILVEYEEDFGRSGMLSGLFITTKDKLELIKGREIYFGEVLGKHSEVFSDECYENCKVTKLEHKDVKFFEKFFGEIEEHGLFISGINPVDCYMEQEEDFNG